MVHALIMHQECVGGAGGGGEGSDHPAAAGNYGGAPPPDPTAPESAGMIHSLRLSGTRSGVWGLPGVGSRVSTRV
eukprot:3940768-Rhodomonas_salina.1